MDLDKNKEIITSFIVNIYILLKNNLNIVILVSIIVIILILTYYFSENNRVSRKLYYLNNKLVYDTPRLQIDYCGIWDNTKDKVIVKIKKYNNGIKITDPEDFNLWKYNLSSEYIVEIKGKSNTTYDNLVNQPYKVESIDPTNTNILYFTKDTKFPATSVVEEAPEKTVELIFYNINPNRNKNLYKHKKLCEYYICSSYNSFLIGNQVFDYCSLEMIKKALYYGSRYIEIPIYDLELKDDTIPIVYSSINDYKLSLNYLEVEKIIETLGEYAFNFRFLENSNDPLFIFLNIKTQNKQTLNKVNDYIETYMSKYLLSKSYNHINMSNIKLCDLENKCVIFSNNGYQDSKLDKLINSSTDKPYLKRITYNEAIINKNDIKGPKFKLNSNYVRFVSSNISDSHNAKKLFNDYIEIKNDINLFNYGIVEGDNMHISGSSNPKNNSGEYTYPISKITTNKIIFKDNVNLTNELSGALITIEIFDKHTQTQILEDYNKENLTIVIPDGTLFSYNYNYKNILSKGCQFIAMNFQNIDDQMISYFNYFKQKAFLFKPRVLINSFTSPKSVSINSMVPYFNKDIVLNNDYELIDKIRDNKNINIKPYNNDKMRVICDTDTNNAVKLSMNYDSYNSRLEIVTGINSQPGHVSIRIKDTNNSDKYLSYNEDCCYLYFKSSQVVDKYKFNNNASFLSLKPTINKKDYNSFGIIKTIGDKEKLYYLKMRSHFNTYSKLFVKTTTEYEVKFYLKSANSNSNDIVILKPKFNPNGEFFPTGDIIKSIIDLETFGTTSQDNSNSTTQVSGPHSYTVQVPTETIPIQNVTFQSYNTNVINNNAANNAANNDNKCEYGYDYIPKENKCYEKCNYGYERSTDSVNTCIEIIDKSTKPAVHTFDKIVKKDQIDNPTKLFSGAVDKPVDYELIWDNETNEDDFDGQQISIWKPIPNDGFMDMGCVFVKGYDKPSVDEVVCISVDYLKEEYLAKDDSSTDSSTDSLIYGTPKYYNETHKLALWTIDESNHSYPKAYPFVKVNEEEETVVIPNNIEFKMYDVIDEEKDYYDRLYLNPDISTDKEKEATLFKLNFDSIVESSGSDVYDYLMKIENSNGKLLSYTPSDTGNKMCMGLPNPYWSPFYKDISNDSKVECDYRKDKQNCESNTKCIWNQNKCESKKIDNTKNKVKFEPCKSRSYFGTNWNIYDDNTIRLEGNPNACLTYNGDINKDIKTDINDENNYLYLDRCGVNDTIHNDINDTNLKNSNQTFEFVNDNIKVLTNTNYDPNACITHAPNDSIRLEECGDKKYTVLSKWNNKVSKLDKCDRIEANQELEKIGAVEVCDGLSYYVVYLTSGIDHKHEEYCSLEDAKKVYEDEKSKWKRGIAIINNGEILFKERFSTNEDLILKNYATKLLNVESTCTQCKYPSKVLCVENSIEDSEYTHFDNDIEKKEISEACSNLTNTPNVKCSRRYRQKFINNIHPRDFCISPGKEVFIYLYSKNQYPGLDINPTRIHRSGVASNGLPADNLLGEHYDDTNYNMFIKGMCTESSDSNKFKIIFDRESLFNSITTSPTIKTDIEIEIPKFSNDIILYYTPSYNELIVGTKVLAELGYQDNEKLLDKLDTNYDKIGFKNTNDNIEIGKSHVRWLAVVINKLKNNQVEVMFSINSYEPNDVYKDDAITQNRPYSITNIRKIYNVKDLILLKQAPICL